MLGTEEATAGDDGDGPPPVPGRGVTAVHSGRAGGRTQGRQLRRQGRATLQRLFDAALEVFVLHGYHNARVEDIVARSNTSRGTFYLYFDDKDDIFRALVLEVADDMLELAGELGPVRPGTEGYEDLRGWLAAFAALYHHHGDVIRVWTEAEVSGSELGDLSREVLAGFAAALSQRIAEAGVDDVDPAVAAVVLVAMIERLHYYAVAGLVDASVDELVATCATVAHAALFGPAARPAPGRRRVAAPSPPPAPNI